MAFTIRRWLLSALIVAMVLLGTTVLHHNEGLQRHFVNAAWSGVTRGIDGWTKDQQSNIPSNLILYNRVDKCASRSLIEIAKTLGERKGYLFHEREFHRGAYHLNTSGMTQEVEFIKNLAKPGFYAPHLHYINFFQFGAAQPVYINIIRDPVDRFVSAYNFMQYGDPRNDRNQSKKHLDINDCILQYKPLCSSRMGFHIGTFFCGQDRRLCNGSPKSVELAIKHIDENYLFVGLAEEFDVNLKILEKILPDYFSGASELWEEIQQDTITNTKTSQKTILTAQARNALVKRLAPDYQVFNHVRSLFSERKLQFGIK